MLVPRTKTRMKSSLKRRMPRKTKLKVIHTKLEEVEALAAKDLKSVTMMTRISNLALLNTPTSI